MNQYGLVYGKLVKVKVISSKFNVVENEIDL